MRELVQPYRYGAVAIAIAALFFAVATLASPPPRASAQTACIATIDFMLVLDGSESISPADFDLMRTFASSLVGRFTVSATDAHAGIVQFAGEGQGIVEVGLSSDPAVIAGAISAMTQIVGATDIQEGIALAQGQLTAGGRPDVPQVMIILTDGEHNQPGDPIAEAESARALGTELFAIAVGSGPDIDQLNAIASDPDGEHVRAVSDFEALATILEPLVRVVCPPTPMPTEEPPVEEVGTPVLGAGPNPPGLLLPSVGIQTSPADDRNRSAGRAMETLAGAGILLSLAWTTYWFARRRAER